MGLISKLVVFGIGVYSGIYIDQNFQVPPVADPKEVWKKLSEFVQEKTKEYRKTPTIDGQVPSVPDAKEAWKKINEFIDEKTKEYKKPPPPPPSNQS